MAITSQVLIVGNLTSDPELRHTSGGKAVVSLTVAVTPRAFNRDTQKWEDGETVFKRCSAWDEMAENIAASLTKGSRVMVAGVLKGTKWTDREGNERSAEELQIDEIGHTMKFHTIRADKRGKAVPAQAAGSSQGPADSGEEVPW